jgi:hypothetical protein
MPEHEKARPLIEAEFERRVKKLSKGRRKQIRAAMGNPPRMSNVPAELWEKLERRQADEIVVLFWLAYLVGWQELEREQGPIPGPAGRPLGDGRPDGQGIPTQPPGEPLDPGTVPRLDPITPVEDIEAWDAATDVIDTITGGMIDKTREKLQEAQDQAEILGTEFKPDEVLADVEGDNRAHKVGVTETTRALVMGERGYEGWLGREHGITMDRIWQTERDARVCPICSPLQGTPDHTWPPLLFSGPPAHPVCRCWVTFSTTKKAPAILPAGALS